MALDPASIQAIASRLGNNVIWGQVNIESKILATKTFQEEPVKGKVRIINVRSGMSDAAGLVDSSSALPGMVGDTIGAGEAPTQLFALPGNFYVGARIPFDSANMVESAADAVSLVQEEMEMAGKSIGYILGRSILSPVLGTNSAAALGNVAVSGSGTVVVSDRDAFKVGQLIDLFAASSGVPTGSRISVLKVTGITPTAGSTSTGTLSFTIPATIEGAANAATGSGSAAANDRVFVIHGSYLASASSSRRFFGMRDVTDTTTSGAGLYNQTVSGADWNAQSSGTAADVTPNRLKEMMTRVRQAGGSRIDVLIMNPRMFDDLHESMFAGATAGGGQRQFNSGNEDYFGDPDKPYKFNGASIVCDDNCPLTSIWMLNRAQVKLGKWRELSAMDPKNRVQLSETRYDYLIKIAGMYQMIVLKRNNVGIFNCNAPTAG